MTNIFKTLAPTYWSADLPAIPLQKHQKRPAIDAWTVYAERMPTADEQAVWLERHADGNIGLVLGPRSGLVAFDIDTEDFIARKVIDRILPPTPWRRVGKKGEVRMYRYSGERTARISSDKGMICEILSKGTQVVLPGSIHPDTKQPYTATGNLWEVYSALPVLSANIEDTLRSALLAAGIKVGGKNAFKVTNFVPAGARNNAMTAHAGLLARAVTRGERTLLEALAEMEEWVESYVEKVVGDVMSADEAKKKVIYFVMRDVQGPAKKALPVGWDDGLSAEDKQRLGLNLGDGDEKWSLDDIMNDLMAEFTVHTRSGCAGQLEAANTAMERLARSEIDIIGQDRVMNFIVARSGGTVKLPTLRRKLRELQMGDIAGENHNEIANAALKQVEPFGQLRYTGEDFWQWNGAYWAIKPEGEIVKLIGTEFGNLPACRKDSDYKQVVRFMRDLTDQKLATSVVGGINFANGFLDEDLVLHPHQPEFGATYVLPYRYLPDEAGKMPRFYQFLDDSWGRDPDREQKVMAVQEAMGATLFGVATRYQRAFCLIGVPASGKSVMSKVVRALVPDGAISSIPPEQWNDRFLPAQMFGKLLNFAGELSGSRKINGEWFKQIVEGEVITGQHKNKDPFPFNPTVSQWFNSNHLPQTDDTSGGFFRRWLCLEWNQPVPEDRRVPDLHRFIVDEEREAIAAWAVQGFTRLKRQGRYTEPASHKALVERMAAHNNSVWYFLRSSPTLSIGRQSTDAKVGVVDLFEAYTSFCYAKSVDYRERANLKKFIEMMRALQAEFGFRVVGNDDEIVFQGIEVVTAGARKLHVVQN